MTHAFRASPFHLKAWLRSHIAIGLYALAMSLALNAVAPAKSQAAMPDADILLDYGFRGFTLGAELGLSVGYLSAGNRYEQHEWRKLVLGMGIGALAGLTTGIIIAVADVASGSVPVGYYVLRDAGYGTWIGAAVGAIVGALLWVDDGRPRDLIQGAAYGSLFGAVAGLAYGIIEGKNATPPSHHYNRYDSYGKKAPTPPRHRYEDDWRFSVSPLPSSGLAAMVAKRF
jgi:hypothetical protein